MLSCDTQSVPVIYSIDIQMVGYSLTLNIQNYSPSVPTSNFTAEGCFCPDGTVLFNRESSVCVEKCGKYTVSLML